MLDSIMLSCWNFWIYKIDTYVLFFKHMPLLTNVLICLVNLVLLLKMSNCFLMRRLRPTSSGWSNCQQVEGSFTIDCFLATGCLCPLWEMAAANSSCYLHGHRPTTVGNAAIWISNSTWAKRTMRSEISDELKLGFARCWIDFIMMLREFVPLASVVSRCYLTPCCPVASGKV